MLGFVPIYFYSALRSQQYCTVQKGKFVTLYHVTFSRTQKDSMIPRIIPFLFSGRITNDKSFFQSPVPKILDRNWIFTLTRKQIDDALQTVLNQISTIFHDEQNLALRGNLSESWRAGFVHQTEIKMASPSGCKPLIAYLCFFEFSEMHQLSCKKSKNFQICLSADGNWRPRNIFLLGSA